MYHTKQTVFDTNCRPVHVNAESFFNHVFSYTDIAFYRYGLLNWTLLVVTWAILNLLSQTVVQ